MTTSAFLSYVTAVAVVIWVPGPNTVLVADAGARRGVAGIAAFSLGDLTTNVGQMTIAAAGLAAVIRAHPAALVALQWAGVAALMALALRAWSRGRSTAPRPSRVPTATTLPALAAGGMLASAVNPTAMAFFAALLPPFVDPARPLPAQVAIMAAAWIVMDGATLAAYGLFGGRVIRAVEHRRPRWAARINAGSLLAAAMIMSTRTLT